MSFKNITILTALVLLSSFASAEQIYHYAKIDKIILDGVNYGGCMVYMNPNQKLLNCRQDFVSLDCNGEITNTKTHAKSMLDTAQLAFLTDNTVRLRISDSKTINGFCTADYIRIDKQ